ncbi:MAG: response regulator [Verrucomicrobiota bacterium]
MHYNDARIINVAGRQRMLSQQVAKLALLLRQNAFDDAAVEAALREAYKTFGDSHHGLLNRDEAIGLGGENSPEVQELFRLIGASFSELTAAVDRVLELASGATASNGEVEPLFDRLLSSEETFLPMMNRIVFQYDKEATGRNADEVLYETGMLCLVLIVLLLEAMFIFHPAIKQLRMYFEKLFEANQQRDALTKRVEDQNVELQSALHEANESTRLKSEFLATMSHEIRTPMNATVGMTTLLLDTELSAQQREFAETIRQSSDALLVIISDILDFSKIESGKLMLESHVFDLRETVESALSLFSMQAGQKGLNLAYRMDEKVPDFIRADSGRLRQILVNLVGNAVKFTEAGDVTVDVDLAPELNEGRRLGIRFRVKDTGIGIPQEKQNNLFEPFVQADGSTTRRYGGTGLGLSISHLLSELMGGSISVASEVDKGSVFSFTIVARPSTSLIHRTVNAVQDELKGLTVLIVDDNEINRELLAQVVRTWGMEVTIFDSPKKVVAGLENGLSFDIAVLDYHMPEMNGMVLATLIREKFSQTVPLILLTSMTISDQSFEKYFSHTFTKPLRPTLLLESFLENFSTNEPIQQKTGGPPKLIADDLAERIPLKILVADDNVVNLRVSNFVLKRMGYRPDSAINGKEVLHALETQKYDVILLDVHMPIMDGLEAARSIKERYGFDRPWIIALTAAASEEDRQACLAAGMDAYLTKPFKPKDIQDALIEYSEIIGHPAI